jgi:TRAP-type C4-dicarboxylate transport system substrate-binding protein
VDEMKKVLAALATLMVCAALFAGGDGDKAAKDGGQKTYTLKMSTQLHETSPMVKGFTAWADAVAKRTNSGITIQVYPSANCQKAKYV